MTEKTALRSALGILATATARHTPARHTPGRDAPARHAPGRDAPGRDDETPLPRLPGFVESSFSPLAYEVGSRCLTRQPGDGSRTAVALASLMGDTTTADLASRRVISGQVHNPLLFMQATANSILGYLSREFGITGQTFSLSTLDDPLAELLAMADLLLEDPDLDRVLVLGVELGAQPGGESGGDPGGDSGGGRGGAATPRDRVAAAYRELAADSGRPTPPPSAHADLAAAVLLGRADTGAPVSVRPAEPHAADATAALGHPGSLQGLFDLVTAHRRLLRDGGGHRLVTDPAARRGPTAFLLTADTKAPMPNAPAGRNETRTHAHQ
ncbi:hypothetical protein [Streptomyces cuspidosporus]|uniref:Beta-ketoacyl synthase N-terminal domain-containing protein n=1 Tax=Streptomyces cuspidosporus TaxID=66882 RepID=A0ABN3H1S9_9ACTN